MCMCTLHCRVAASNRMYVCVLANKCTRMLRHPLCAGMFPLATTNVHRIILNFLLFVCVCMNEVSSRLASLLHFNACSFFPRLLPFHPLHFSIVHLHFAFFAPWKERAPIAFKTGKYANAMMPFYRLSAPVCLYELLCVGNSTTIEFY